jgi:hypothetical protein
LKILNKFHTFIFSDPWGIGQPQEQINQGFAWQNQGPQPQPQWGQNPTQIQLPQQQWTNNGQSAIQAPQQPWTTTNGQGGDRPLRPREQPTTATDWTNEEQQEEQSTKAPGDENFTFERGVVFLFEIECRKWATTVAAITTTYVCYIYERLHHGCCRQQTITTTTVVRRTTPQVSTRPTTRKPITPRVLNSTTVSPILKKPAPPLRQCTDEAITYECVTLIFKYHQL